jgi:uroporphyrinogen decarboxylase
MNDNIHLERVLKALHREQPDRVPSLEWEIDEGLMEALLPGGNLLDFIEWTDLDGVSIFEDMKKTYLNENTYIDEWGVTLRKTEEYYPISIDYPIKDPSDLAKFIPPDPCAQWHFDSLVAAVERFKGKRAVLFRAHDVLSIPRYLRGMENLMMDFILHPDLLRELVQISVTYNSALVKRAVELGADAIFLTDDYSDNRGPMMSPKHFRQFLLPGFKQTIDTIHEAGVPAIKHTDGNIWPILDDMVNAGIDCIDPLDPLGGMSIGDVKEKYGSRLCLKGNVNIGGALSLGTPDEVRTETLACIQAGKPGGGYILSTSNSLMSCIKPENYMAMLETLREHGEYE